MHNCQGADEVMKRQQCWLCMQIAVLCLWLVLPLAWFSSQDWASLVLWTAYAGVLSSIMCSHLIDRVAHRTYQRVSVSHLRQLCVSFSCASNALLALYAHARWL